MKKQNETILRFRKGSWMLYFFLPLLAIQLGWAEWEWGPRSFQELSGLKLFIQALSFFCFVYFLLISPLKKWVWIEGTPLTDFQLIAISTILLSLPLVSFAYWLGDVRTLLQAQEVTLSIIPPVLLSVLIFNKSRRPFEWASSLSGLVFFHLCLVNEILGPFKTYVYLLSHDYRFEYLRGIYPACIIALYYRLQYETERKSWSGINSIHHAWKSGRFAKVLKPANPGEGSLKAESES